MKKIFLTILAVNIISLETGWAETSAQYPNVSGQVLFEFKPDHVISTTKTKLTDTNAYFNVEPDISINFNKNWSLKSGFRIWPMLSRSTINPERSRTILNNRGFTQDDTGIVVEELKGNFQNDDLKFFFGKFDPTFATLYRKTKRIGVFVTDFTEDYELREKIGGGFAALLDNSEITLNTFFNDNSALSGSAITNRGRLNSNSSLAGNTSTLSSYTLTFEGEKFLGVENLFYNFGYRHLGVNNNGDNKNETGYTVNFEYLQKFNNQASLVPVFEYVKINNFTGKPGRDAQYITTSLIGKYSGWSASIAHVIRNIDGNYTNINSRDRQLQYTIGYKFMNNVSIDISRMALKEDGYKARMIGAMVSYLYKF